MDVIVIVIGSFILASLCLAIPVLTACALIFEWPGFLVFCLLVLSSAELGNIWVVILKTVLSKEAKNDV